MKNPKHRFPKRIRGRYSIPTETIGFISLDDTHFSLLILNINFDFKRIKCKLTPDDLN